MKKYLHKIHNYWLEDASFYALLAIMVFTIFIFPPLMESGIVSVWLLRVVLLVFFFIGIWSAQSRLLVWISLSLFGVTFVVKILEFIDPNLNTELVALIARVLNISVFIVINLKLLFRDDSVTIDRVLGAINVYLLFAFLGAFLFQLIHLANGSSIEGNLILSGTDEDFPHYIYYCLTSLTTVGFGDFVPVNYAAKMLSVALSSVGVLFPAIVIARLVSNSGEKLPKA